MPGTIFGSDSLSTPIKRGSTFVPFLPYYLPLILKKPGEFSQKIVELSLSIPVGRVTTYGILTQAAGGHPMLSRMVTHILGKSDKVDQIPFHRIVYSSGKIWFDPEHNSLRDRLYKEEGIEVDLKGKIKNFEKIVFYFDNE